jgi:hypothetical protein
MRERDPVAERTGERREEMAERGREARVAPAANKGANEEVWKQTVEKRWGGQRGTLEC